MGGVSEFEGVAIGLAVAPLARGLLTDLFGQALAQHVSGQNSGSLVTATMTLVGLFVTDLTSLFHGVFSLFLWEDPCGIQRSADPNRNCSVVQIKALRGFLVKRNRRNYFLLLDFPGMSNRLSLENNRAPSPITRIADNQFAGYAL